MRSRVRAGKHKAHHARLAEELERRVLLSSAVAAFAPQITFGVGSQPRSVAPADVNSDGKLDLIVTNGAANTAGVLLGNANGTFGPQATFTTGTTPFGVVVADVSRDGRLDLITANNGSGNVSVLLGNGNGTFQTQQQLAAGTQARFVAAADINGDGKPDLLVANYGATTGTLSVLLGNGNGTFATQQTFAAGAQASSITVGDFNRDGKPDLAVANKSAGTVSVLLGNGNGTFTPATALPTGTGSKPFSLASGDVNADGKLDLVAAEETSGAVGVILGNGNGTFANQTTFAAGPIACAVVVADINGDGKLDIASANYSGNDISVLLGNGNGTFVAQKTFGTGSGSEPFSISSGDVNRDGWADLVVGNFGSGSVGVLAADVLPQVTSINRSNPSSQSTSASSVTFAINFNKAVTGIDATDFALVLNGVSASPPLVVSGSGANYTVTVNGVVGTGTLGLNLVDDGTIRDSAGNGLAGSRLIPQQTFGTVAEPNCVTAGDVNGDGITDLLVGDTQTSIGVHVLLGNGNGTFKPDQLAGTAPNPYQIIVCDANGDGRPDLVVTNPRYFLEALLGNGNGTFQTPLTFGSPSTSGAAVGDINGDGRVDVAYTDVVTNMPGIVLGNGNGTFGAAQTLTIAGIFPIFLSLADMNGDGRPDMVVAGGAEELLGNGDGTFQPQRTFSAGGQTIHLDIADVNNDGKPDIVSTLNGAPQLSVLPGNGDGTFQPYQTPAIGTFAESIAAADVNRDGRLDLVVTHRNNNKVGVLLGNGDGTFGAEQTYAVDADPRRLAIGDFNGDGRPDVATANFYGNDVSVLLSGPGGNFTGQSYSIVPSVPLAVTAIARSNPAGATATGTSVRYAVSFNEPVTGVDATDFRVVTSGGVTSAVPVVVIGSGASYTVTVSGITGSGTLQLNLVDDDSIVAGAGNPLGGVGAANGSFSGQTYTVLTGASTFPTVLSINRTNPAGPQTAGGSVSYAVTFSEPVTGVDPTDFSLALNGVMATTPVVVSGSGANYTVTVNGVSGYGTLGLNLVDDGSIQDAAGHKLGAPFGNVLGAPQTYATTPLAFCVTTADVNGDGKTDLIVGDHSAGRIGILLGNGNGTFLAFQTIPSGFAPQQIVVADLNGDGRPDLVVGNVAGPGVLLLGNGNGTFQTGRTFGSAVASFGVAVGDVNGDGIPDIASTGFTAYGVAVALGNGDGTFGPQKTITVAKIPELVSIADMNNDGRPDLVVTSSSRLCILLGNGNGTFQTQQTYSVVGGQYGTAIADVNSDGNWDVITSSNLSSSGVSVLLGNGNGTFQNQETYPTGSGPMIDALADINGDGKLDVIVVCGTTPVGSVSVLMGNGDGTFGALQTYAVATNPRWVAAGDVNADGRSDVFTANYNDNNVSVLMAGSNGSFTGQVYTVAPSAPVVTAISRSNPAGPTVSGGSVSYAVSFNEPVTGVDATDFALAMTGGVTSTTPVVVAGSGASYTVTINGISGSGTLGLNLVDDGTIQDAFGHKLAAPAGSVLEPQQTYTSTSAPFCVTAADINGDGKTDVIVGDHSGHIGLLLGNGNGSFQPEQVVATNTSTYAPYQIAVADVNGDGRADLVVGNEGVPIILLLGNGNGTFQAGKTIGNFISNGVNGIAVEDVNGDGKQDIVTVGGFRSPYAVAVALGNGDGTFGPQNTIAVAKFPELVSIADMNNDGRPDLVVTASSSLCILIGNGNGTFQAQQTHSVVGGQYGTAIADLNSDGNWDVVTTNDLNGSGVSVLLGNGNGTFQNQETYPTASGPVIDAVADINGDGKLDVMVACRTTPVGSVSVLMGNGDGTFGALQTYAVGTDPRWIAAADLNGDGRADVITPNILGNTLSVLLANPSGSFTGQTYTVVGSQNVINGTGGDDDIILTRDADGTHIDWTLNTLTAGQVLINDASGLTINGNGGHDTIDLNYGNGDPLPNTLHLNGTFTINGLQVATPLAGTDLEIGRSTVWITYSGASPASMILAALSAGYNGGAWNGTAANGVITSSAAAGNAKHNTAIGWADSADGTGLNATPNSIELKYTLVGDVNLDGAVNITDVNALVPHYNSSGSWTGGDFNYDGAVNITDVNALVPNYNTSLGSQVQPATAGAGNATSSPTVTPDVTTSNMTAEVVNGAASTPITANTADSDSSIFPSGKSKRRPRR